MKCFSYIAVNLFVLASFGLLILFKNGLGVFFFLMAFSFAWYFQAKEAASLGLPFRKIDERLSLQIFYGLQILAIGSLVFTLIMYWPAANPI